VLGGQRKSIGLAVVFGKSARVALPKRNPRWRIFNKQKNPRPNNRGEKKTLKGSLRQTKKDGQKQKIVQHTK